MYYFPFISVHSTHITTNFTPAILNLGYAYPQVYVSSSQGVHRQLKIGAQKKKCPKQAHIGGIFDFGGTQGGTILVWGYAEIVNFFLVVRKYLKVENPCFTPIPSFSFLISLISFTLISIYIQDHNLLFVVATEAFVLLIPAIV